MCGGGVFLQSLSLSLSLSLSQVFYAFFRGWRQKHGLPDEFQLSTKHQEMVLRHSTKRSWHSCVCVCVHPDSKLRVSGMNSV